MTIHHISAGSTAVFTSNRRAVMLRVFRIGIAVIGFALLASWSKADIQIGYVPLADIG